MPDPRPQPDIRQEYEETLDRAMEHALRHVSWDQAFEIAHDVASDMVRRRVANPTGALIYRAVTYRLRNLWRGTNRRAVAERIYHDERADGPASRAEPSSELETRELRQVIALAIADMPNAMRQAFTLVRQHELSYKEAAARLGVGVGTIHTQLSRASALLRQAIGEYQRAETPRKSTASKQL